MGWFSRPLCAILMQPSAALLLPPDLLEKPLPTRVKCPSKVPVKVPPRWGRCVHPRGSRLGSVQPTGEQSGERALPGASSTVLVYLMGTAALWG